MEKLVEAWQVYDLDNEALFKQRESIENALKGSHDSASEAKMQELLLLVNEEMKERGVAYALGARLQSLAAATEPSGVVDAKGSSSNHQGSAKDARDPVVTKHDDAPAAQVDREPSRFHDLLGLRPPWFNPPTQAGEQLADKCLAEAEPTRRGLWDHSSSSDDSADKHDINHQAKQKRRNRRASGNGIGVMNKLGFFVVPSKMRKKKPDALPPPAVAEKKPAIPFAARRRGPLDEPSNGSKKAGPIALRKKLPPVQQKRSSTAVPFEGGRAPLELPPRPLSADELPPRSSSAELPTCVASSPTQTESLQPEAVVERIDVSQPMDYGESVLPMEEDSGVEAVEIKPSVTLPVETPTHACFDDNDPGHPSLTTVPQETSVIPDLGSETFQAPPRAPIDPPKVKPSVSALVSMDDNHSNRVDSVDVHRRATEEPNIRSTSAVVVSADAPVAAAVPPAGTSAEYVDSKIDTVESTSIKRKSQPSPPQPPFPSLEAMMIDPSYFFAFDSQPAEVRRQAFTLMRDALRRWLHIPAVSSTPGPNKTHATRLRLPSVSANSDGTHMDDDELREDRSRWYYCQTSHDEVYELVTAVLEGMECEDGASWREVPSLQQFPVSLSKNAHEQQVPNCWSLWWTWGKPRVQQKAVWLRGAQYVNHIPKSWQLTKKDALKSNVQRYCRNATVSATSSGGANRQASHRRQMFEIVPPSFTLPKEYVAFATYFADKRGTWIMKTIGMSRGRGIRLVSDIADVIYDAPVVVQRYIDRPLTVDGGYKFDLRIYVLVTSFQPQLEAFISTLGFARIAAYRYNAADLSNVFAHLTNTSVSGAAKCGKGRKTNGPVPRVDTKWTLERLKRDIDMRHENSSTASWNVLWADIKAVVLKALVCVEDNIPAAPCTFELFGFDVLIDEHFEPWVLEVNASPSLEVDCAEDEEVKPQLIQDIVSLLDIPHIDRYALLAALERRLAPPGAPNKSTASPASVWAEECAAILRGWVPRKLGAAPSVLGNFEPIAPSTSLYSQLHKAKRAI